DPTRSASRTGDHSTGCTAGSGHDAARHAAGSGNDQSVDAPGTGAAPLEARQRLRRTRWQRVSPAAREARRLGDQRRRKMEARLAVAARDPARTFGGTSHDAGAAFAAVGAPGASARAAERRSSNDQSAVAGPAGPQGRGLADEPAAPVAA